jgi:hypothetical protein
MMKQQALIAQRTNRNVPLRLRNIESYEDMLYLVDRFFNSDHPRPGTARAWIESIAEVRGILDEYGERLYPYPHMYTTKDGINFVEKFRNEAHEQYIINREMPAGLTQTALGEVSDASAGRRKLRGLGKLPEYFAIGIHPQGGMIVDGAKGAGKSEFVAQYVLRPIPTYYENVLIVHNMNLVDPRHVMKPKIEGETVGPYCNLKVAAKDKNAMLLNNFYYATSYTDALLKIVEHAKQGIVETGRPYLTVWVVDEGGLSRSKQRTMSNKNKNQKDLSLISRKLGCFEIIIYQLDDAPAELKLFATHRYHKPSSSDKTLVDSVIDSEEFRESGTFTGLMSWHDLKIRGESYIEYGTYDFPTMNTDFDMAALMDKLQSMGKFGMPVDTVDQLDEIRDFILKIGQRRLHSFGRERFMLYLYRLHHRAMQEYEKIKADGKMSKSEKLQALKWRSMASYPSLTFMAQLEFPDEKWYEKKIEREMERIEEIYPDALEMDALPFEDDFPLDVDAVA